MKASVSHGTILICHRIDFEDTYDGLGDALDETDDVFNDDTFGGTNTGKTLLNPSKRLLVLCR